MGTKRVEEQVALAALFFGFLKVSLLGFGGPIIFGYAASSSISGVG